MNLFQEDLRTDQVAQTFNVEQNQTLLLEVQKQLLILYHGKWHWFHHGRISPIVEELLLDLNMF